MKKSINDMIKEGKVKLILKGDMLDFDEQEQFENAVQRLKKISIDSLIDFLNLEDTNNENN